MYDEGMNDPGENLWRTDGTIGPMNIPDWVSVIAKARNSKPDYSALESYREDLKVTCNKYHKKQTGIFMSGGRFVMFW